MGLQATWGRRTTGTLRDAPGGEADHLGMVQDVFDEARVVASAIAVEVA